MHLVSTAVPVHRINIIPKQPISSMFFQTRILLLFNLVITINVCAQSWSPLESGTNGNTYTLTADERKNILYVGGGFSIAGNNQAKSVAMWNGINWLPLDSGFTTGLVAASCLYNEELYVGGSFLTLNDSSGNQSISARWDGVRLHTFTINTGITAMLTDTINNLLYLSGNFTQVNGVSCNGICAWNGITWSALGSGLNGAANVLFADSTGNLYTGGSFTEAGGIQVNGIAVWNGTSWSSLGSGFDDVVWTINIYKGEIYAGGYFHFAGAIPVDYFAKWNGVGWESVGAGTNGNVFSSCVYNSELYIGGEFDTVNGIEAKGIARWNSSAWLPAGTGVSSIGGLSLVQTLAVYKNELYAGGVFDSAGGMPAKNIAKWSLPVSIYEVEQNALITLSPNPVSATLFVQRKEAERGKLVIFDITGKSVQTFLFKDTEIFSTIPLRIFSSGVYYYQYHSANNQRKIVTGKVIIGTTNY